MNAAAANVEEWKKHNSARLVQCRWGCAITMEACRAYQSRTVRYVNHFNGQRVPYPRANAEYLRCLSPEACPHVMSDQEAGEALEARRLKKLPSETKLREHRAREMQRFVNPEEMLKEAEWHRSLLAN